MERDNIHKTIGELFNGKYKYIVPLYQRNFAWTEQEITQLMQDLYESFRLNVPYFVGSIVVLSRDSEAPVMFEVIDGQQRLTVLTLLLGILPREYVPHLSSYLEYDSRDEVSSLLNSLYANPDSLPDADNDITATFATAVRTIRSCPLDADDEDITLSSLGAELPKFISYILTQVYFVLAEMPEDTDVATYFEIINNSGDQLRKHEILKARILDTLKDRLSAEEMRSVAFVWDACSQMDVRIHNAIPAAKRHLLFGDNFSSFIPENITCIFESDGQSPADQPLTITDIINDPRYAITEKKQEKEAAEDDKENKGESVIDFPNFLMHVFRLCYNDSYQEIAGHDKSIPLNEKSLLEVYNKLSGIIDGLDFVSHILYYRIILDRYMVRTDSNDKDARWTLKRPHKSSSGNDVWYSNTFGKNSDQNKSEDEPDTRGHDNVIKALSMLQVSYPQRKYKNFLNEILSWFSYGTVSYDKNWYLPKLNALILRYIDETISHYGSELYNRGTQTPRLILNSVDYLLYLSKDTAAFDFRYYNSVEHHLPRSREKYNNYDIHKLDSIGNLFLLSRSANSSLNASDPITKADKASSLIDTMPPNRRYIYEKTRKNRHWDLSDIAEHEKDIISLLDSRHDILRHIRLEENNLLYRACLAVADYCKEVGYSNSGTRYSFSDLNSAEGRNARRTVEEWQSANLNKGLESFIDEQLSTSVSLKSDSWRLCFAKYPSVTRYCKKSNFTWQNDGARVFLLPGNRVVNDARELRSHLVFEKIKAVRKNTIIDKYGLWIPLDGTQLKSLYPKSQLYLHIWVNHNATRWCYELYSERAAHASENVAISDNGWARNNGGHYYLPDRPYLCDCPADYEEAVSIAINEADKMLAIIDTIR